MNRFFVAVCFASICWMCSSLHAQDGASTPKTACTTGNLLAEPPNRVKAITVFWDELEAAIRKNDKRRVANLISYPLSVSTWTAEFRVRSEGELISRYDEVFPKDLKKLLLRQRAECISRVGAQGFSIGHGEIWFDLFPNGKVRIFTINPVEPDAGGLPLNPDRGGLERVKKLAFGDVASRSGALALRTCHSALALVMLLHGPIALHVLPRNGFGVQRAPQGEPAR